jgi:excinuclease ABC subunit C
MFEAKSFLKSLTTRSGVYQMLDKCGKIIYIGKAQNLRQRVSSYFRENLKDSKTIALMRQVASVQVIITHTANEALLLENNLIKQHRPRYNILFRDDKSYPYIFLSADEFPRIDLYRGTKHKKGRYFGPYPSVVAVRETLNLLHKLFLIRSCKNSFFNSRSRPCLQYQIKRCSGPCVELISQKDYAQDIHHVELFLEGKDDVVTSALIERMDAAAKKLQYETAAKYRDQIQHLREIQSQQLISSKRENIDTIAVVEKNGVVCVCVLILRHGRMLGNKFFFHKLPFTTKVQEIIATFIMQYYLSFQDDMPQEILLNYKLSNLKNLHEVLAAQKGKKIKLHHCSQGKKGKWLKMALLNAEQAINSYLSSKKNLYQQFLALQKALSLAELPKFIECFDISHTMGEATVGSCVVFNVDGAMKNNYRRFNIEGITGGDDFAAMKQALIRHYLMLKEKGKEMPGVLIIDGGKGQLKKAQQVFEELQITGVALLAIAKGKERKLGLETIYMSGKTSPLNLANNDPAFHLIQRVRDEAHRFAITGHRKKRAKARQQSKLLDIPSVGLKRRQNLLIHFGGLQGILKAGVEDLTKVPGISRTLAQQIYDFMQKRKV